MASLPNGDDNGDQMYETPDSLDIVDEEENEPCDPLDLQVPVTGFEILESRAQFTVFKLLVKVSGIPQFQIFRRYTDFCRLQEQLRRSYRGLRLTLPPKRWFGGNFDRCFLEDRQLGLQAFLHSICAHPNLNRCTALRKFLCLDGDAPPTDPVAEVFQHQRQNSLPVTPVDGDKPGAHEVHKVFAELQVESARRRAAELECDRLRRQNESLMQALRLERNYFRQKLSALSAAAVANGVAMNDGSSSDAIPLTPPQTDFTEGDDEEQVEEYDVSSSSEALPVGPTQVIPCNNSCSENEMLNTACSLDALETNCN